MEFVKKLFSSTPSPPTPSPPPNFQMTASGPIKVPPGVKIITSPIPSLNGVNAGPLSYKRHPPPLAPREVYPDVELPDHTDGFTQNWAPEESRRATIAFKSDVSDR